VDHSLWDETFLHKIEQLTLVSRRRRMGRLVGERRSPKRGSSVEFADYREYTPGDDLRQLDWNIYARLGKLFVKLFEEEEDLTVHVLLDTSRSMDWDGLYAAQTISGSDAPILHTEGKFRYARRIAAALGYIALSSLDRVWMGAIHGAGVQRLGPLRGHHHALSLLHFLERLHASGDTDLSAALRSYLVRQRQPGLLYLISDMLSPSGSLDGLRMLQSAGFEVNLIHILDPAEVNPLLALTGDLRLRDIETGEVEEVSVEPSTIGIYEEKYQVWQHSIAAFCAQRSIPYYLATTDVPFEDLILHYLRRRGMLA
jgi:uncharacterized protein (DUF58 family)